MTCPPPASSGLPEPDSEASNRDEVRRVEDAEAAVDPPAHDSDGPTPPVRQMYPDGPSRQFACDAARLLTDLHCEDVLVFDVREVSQITDYLVLGSGTSERQLMGVASRVIELAKERGIERYGGENDAASTWRVIDFSSIMFHLFEPLTRAHYDLEMLWGDAPRVNWRDEEQIGRDQSAS
ncbi:ribosome silencing factor [Mucisphaera sp.]|uniref:ribosome silencing factor n=1 Tax=Mucisphaera sp. TaxID=2913024 RepID=UPI003D0CB8F9